MAKIALVRMRFHKEALEHVRVAGDMNACYYSNKWCKIDQKQMVTCRNHEIDFDF